MNILVTTSRHLFLIDTENDFYEKIYQDQGLYYGISYSNKLIFVGARNSLVGSKKIREKEQGKILVYNFHKQKLKEI